MYRIWNHDKRVDSKNFLIRHPHSKISSYIFQTVGSPGLRSARRGCQVAFLGRSEATSHITVAGLDATSRVAKALFRGLRVSNVPDVAFCYSSNTVYINENVLVQSDQGYVRKWALETSHVQARSLQGRYVRVGRK